MQRVTHALLDEGVRIFTLTFHSPSLATGLTHYVPTDAERDAFHRRVDRYLDWFTGTIGGLPTTPDELHAELLGLSPPAGVQTVSTS
jgi:hypothetical protein